MRIRLKIFYLLIIVIWFRPGSEENCSAQVSGLGFNSYSVTKDMRTGIELFPVKPMEVHNDFDLSFNFRLRTGETMYFGYVFRIISGDNNLDLIFNYDGPKVNYFTLVQGQRLLARVKSDFARLSADWNKFDFKFNIHEKSFTVNMLDTVFKVNDLQISKNNSINMFFGLCNTGNFKTTDVPAMDLQNISITERNHGIHEWPLNETTGQSARDILGKSNALVINPVWLKSEHFTWREIFSRESDGFMWCAYNSRKDELVMVNSQNVITLSVSNNKTNTITSRNTNLDIAGSRQAVFDTISDRFYLLDIDKPSASSFDFRTGMWSGDLEAGKVESDFLHYSKFLSETDTSVYFFGGYGHHQYKNTIQKLNLENGRLKLVYPGGDFFNPRYLAGLGRLNDTIYIIGGFGSNKGDQILNPHSYSDLMAFSLKDKSFHKKFDIKPRPEDLAFSNSIIIDPADRSYYGLTFPIFNYNGYLQLIKGSLDSPEYKVLGSKIPFQFLDISSFSDLYFSRQARKFVAVTIKTEEGKTQLKVYTLDFPPDQQPESVQAENTKNHLLVYIFSGLALILIITAAFFWRRRKNPAAKFIKREFPRPAVPHEDFSPGKSNVSCLNLFGDFQVISFTGEDITRKFTPLLKELFLLIWLNSVKNDIGISNEKIIEILWNNFPDASAQNNKAVNIAKLRAILSSKFSCSLSFKNTGYWRIDYRNKNVVNDYYEFVKITSSKTDLSRPEIMKLVGFSQKGQFLANLKYSWLEEYKVAVSNEMISRLVKHLKFTSVKNEPDTVIMIADAIFKFDSLNEEALENKCRALITLGRHAVAKEVYDQFARDYRTLYSREYEKSFTTIASYR